MDKKKEIAAYVRNNVEFYEERLSIALGRMERNRCPLRMADCSLFDDIVSAIDDWCWDNEFDDSEVDWEDVIDGEDGIIWAE